MKEEIKDYLDKKIYGAKKTALAIALCGAATLALTGCGKDNSNEPMFPPPLYATEQQIAEPNMYRLHTPEGYKDFEIKSVDSYLSSGNKIFTYKTEDDQLIKFQNSGCAIYSENNDLIYFTTNASMEKISYSIDWQNYNENENASNALSYKTNEIENSMDLEN